jgi:hypothetical protein
MEDLSIIISEAVYEECFDVADYQDSTLSEVEEETSEMLFGGDIETLFGYMYGHLGDCSWNNMHNEMPKTFMACTLLLPWLSDRCRKEDYDLSNHSLYFDFNNQNILEV